MCYLCTIVTAQKSPLSLLLDNSTGGFPDTAELHSSFLWRDFVITALTGTLYVSHKCWEMPSTPSSSSNVVHFCEPGEHSLGLSLTALNHKLQSTILHLSAMMCYNGSRGEDLDAGGGMRENWCEFLCRFGIQNSTGNDETVTVNLDILRDSSIWEFFDYLMIVRYSNWRGYLSDSNT